MSLGIRYKSSCDGCGRNVFVPRARTRASDKGDVVPVGDVLCKGCTKAQKAGATLRYDAPSVVAP